MKAKPTPKTAAKATTVSKEEARWRAEDDMRTLLRAEEIKADKARLSKASTIAKQQLAAVSKVAKAKR